MPSCAVKFCRNNSTYNKKCQGITFHKFLQMEHQNYNATKVDVNTCYMGQFKCRVYISRQNPLPRGDRARLPLERWPSRSTRKVIILGAIEHSLPRYYIYFLWRLKHNGEKGLFEQECLRRRYAKDPVCECAFGEGINRKLLKRELPNYQKTLKARERKKKDPKPEEKKGEDKEKES